jgi:hypothetical protein
VTADTRLYHRRLMSQHFARVLGATALVMVHACSAEEPSPKSCNAAGCGGAPIALNLIDDRGQAAAARGTLRELAGSSNPWTFNCAAEPPEARFPLGCDNGVLTVSVFGPNSKFEVQFELADGNQSEWQSVGLELTERTLEDFNGPGCPCTIYEGSSAPITVPATAK